MISSNTRATRSRYSSPAHQTTQLNGVNGTATRESSTPLDLLKASVAEAPASRTFMDRWLEPSVQNKSSYEQAGLMKHGVVENMAPLGALPKPKRMEAGMGMENGNGPAKRKIILRPSSKGASQDMGDDPRTPGVTAVATATAQAEAEADALASTSTPELPLTATSTRAPASAPASSALANAPQLSPTRPARKSLAARDADQEDDDYDPRKPVRRKPLGRPSLPKRGRPPSSARRTSMASVKVSPAKSSLKSPVKRRSATPPPASSHGPEFVEKVIEAAVDEALQHYRYPTAWALRTLYDEKANDEAFVSMIEEVFSQSADAETYKSFTTQLEQKKREGKKDNQGMEYFEPPENGQVTPPKPKPAPYAKLIHGTPHGHGGKDEGDDRASKKVKLSHRSANSTPRKMGRTGVKTPSSRRRARRDSGASDSSLSSVENLSSPELPHDSDITSGAQFASPSLRGTARAKAKARAKAQAEMKVKGRGSLKARRAAQREADENEDPFVEDGPDGPDGPEGPEAEAGVAGSRSPSSGATRPITTRRKSLASSSSKQQRQQRLQRQHASQRQQHLVVDASNSPSSSPTHDTFTTLSRRNNQNNGSTTRPSRDEASMPGRIASSAQDSFFTTAAASNANNANGQNGDKSAAHSSFKGASKAHMHEGRDEAWEKRQEAQKITNGYVAAESWVRDEEARETTPVRTTRKTRQSLLTSAASTRATRSAHKRGNDDGDRFASPSLLSVQGDGSSVAGSRAVTPTAGPRAAKKQKTGLRVKSSPVKKKGGTAAGVPRSVSEAQSSATNGAKDQVADNDENCSACGNAGDVVCCDGCPRSFHFECVDMDQSADLPDEWYCNECLVKRYPSRVPVHKGVFGGPLNLLEKSIPRAFSLPKRVQNRFEGVKAGADGDYEEATTSRSTRRKTNGYEESPDFFKQREDGEAVLCHDCLKPATDVRAIISCSVCPLHWHTDCLDPPLAVPPVLKTWKCPAHADELLQQVPSLAPAHRYRKVKNAAPVVPALSRGLRNNGHIEIDWGSEPEEDDSGWRDIASFGRTYKVSAKGVRLDFIEQLRKQGAGYAPVRSESRRHPYLTPPVEDRAPPKPGSLEDRNVEEMQASLVLTSLKSTPADGVEQLTSALLSSAEPNVISLIAQGDADNIAQERLAARDQVSLRALLAQMETMGGKIRQMLGDEAPPLPTLPPMTGRQGPPSTIADSKGSVDKMDTEPLVTEPTPPSTIDHEGVMDYE